MILRFIRNLFSPKRMRERQIESASSLISEPPSYVLLVTVNDIPALSLTATDSKGRTGLFMLCASTSDSLVRQFDIARSVYPNCEFSFVPFDAARDTASVLPCSGLFIEAGEDSHVVWTK